jgi:hypothetical protein
MNEVAMSDVERQISARGFPKQRTFLFPAPPEPPALILDRDLL